MVMPNNKLHLPVNQATLRGGQMAAAGPEILKPRIRLSGNIVDVDGVRRFGERLEKAGLSVDEEDFDVYTSRSVLDPILWLPVVICSPLLTAESFRPGETPLVHRIRSVFAEQYPGLFVAGVGTVELDLLVVKSLQDHYQCYHARARGEVSVSFFLEDSLNRTVQTARALDKLLAARVRATSLCVDAVKMAVSARGLAYDALGSGPVSKNLRDVAQITMKQQLKDVASKLVATPPSAPNRSRSDGQSSKAGKNRGGGRGGRGNAGRGRGGGGNKGGRGAADKSTDSD
jgi:uncharacterized membrane protein YgcG